MNNKKTNSARGTNKKANYRNKNKSKRGYDLQEVESVDTKSNNDASWYGANPQILKDAASIAFNINQGSPQSDKNFKLRMAGIMKISMYGIPGISDSSTSALNVASRNIYSYVRHANAGHTNYEAPDLMLYLVAMDQAYMFYAWLRRTYALMRTFAQRNRYIPKPLVESMGFNYDDLVKQLSDFRLYINTFAQKCGSLVTPSGMTYFLRHSWLFSNLFADSPNEKAQYVYFNPAGFGKYSPKTSETGGELTYDEIASNMTLEDIIKYGDALLEPLLSDEDINIMSGDILKAYGDSVNKLGMIDENEAIIPVYNPEVLTQIQNLRVTPLAWDKVKVNQNAGYLVCELDQYKSTDDVWEWYDFEGTRMFTLPLDNPTPEDVIVATRLIPSLNSEGHFTSAGTEVVTAVRLFRINDTGSEIINDSTISTELKAYDVSGGVPSMSNIQQIVTHLCSISRFNMHPRFTVIAYMTDKHTIIYRDTHLDLANYTNLDNTDIKQMNDIAVLNEFDVPQMGVYKR